MHRCFIEQERWEPHAMVPSPEEEHHIRHVLRAKDGEAVAVFDGSGAEVRARIRSAPGLPFLLEIEQRLPVVKRGFEITLIQAVLKGGRMDLLMEKATELGVARIIPVMTARVISRVDDREARHKTERWRRIAVSAAKQCGTRWLPVIEAPLPLDQAVHALSASGTALLASLAEGTLPLGAVLNVMRRRPPDAVSVFTGPEGDFTPDETSMMRRAGAVPVSLGGLTLRAETAAIYVVSVLACTFMWTALPPDACDP